jgi:hypothetical protein
MSVLPNGGKELVAIHQFTGVFSTSSSRVSNAFGARGTGEPARRKSRSPSINSSGPNVNIRFIGNHICNRRKTSENHQPISGALSTRISGKSGPGGTVYRDPGPLEVPIVLQDSA